MGIGRRRDGCMRWRAAPKALENNVVVNYFQVFWSVRHEFWVYEVFAYVKRKLPCPAHHIVPSCDNDDDCGDDGDDDDAGDG